MFGIEKHQQPNPAVLPALLARIYPATVVVNVHKGERKAAQVGWREFNRGEEERGEEVACR